MPRSQDLAHGATSRHYIPAMTDQKHKVSNVFVPGRLPDLTYNPRANLQLEDQLNDYLDEGGAILTVAGPTKTGKSVLLQQVVPDPVWLDGQAVTDVETLWRLVGEELVVYTGAEKGVGESATGGGSVSSKAGIGPLVQVGAQATYTATDSESRKYSVERPVAAVVSKALVASARPLVIDDFHFIDRAVQRQVVRALKPVVLAGNAVILVSISHRAQDVVTAEGDMTGRVVPLTVPFWSEADLMQIAQKGFSLLNVHDEQNGLANFLAEQCYGSPHLMQKFCRELCKLNGVRETAPTTIQLQKPEDWTVFLQAQVDATSRDWFQRLLTGPEERGTTRNQWQVRGDGLLDGYGLTLLAISRTGPKLTLTKAEIKAAVDAAVEGASPQAHQTTRVLQRMTMIASKRATGQAPTEAELDAEQEGLPDIQPVLEYMEDGASSTLHLADPFFAFYLAWAAEQHLADSQRPESVEEPAGGRDVPGPPDAPPLDLKKQRNS